MITKNSSLKEGFTLIEIVVAVLIVGLMLGLGLGAFRYIKQAKFDKTRTKLVALNQALIEYETRTSQWPNSLEDLVTKPANVRGWDMPFATEEELKDAWNQQFEYRKKEKGARPPYELYSYGPNGEGAPDNEYIRLEDITK